ncbi:MAG: hypothetical protein AAFY88_07305 [Acidobacteriota bacterium]
MSDENETPNDADTHDAAADTKDVESDDFVNAKFQVTLIPGENVSAHFSVLPKDSAHAVTSVTLSFVQKHEGIVVHSFAGSTVQEAIEPRDGQGAAGDAGVDVAVFNGRPEDGDLFAVLAGTVKTADGPANFFFSRQFYA